MGSCFRPYRGSCFIQTSTPGSRPGRVARGDCSPQAPADPYVHVLMHTVPQIMGSLRMVVTPSRTLRWGERPPTPLSVVVALTLIEIRCSHRVSLLRSHQMTSRFPPPGPPEKRSPVSTVLSGCYDALRPSRRTSYSFAWRYRSGCRLIRSVAGVGHHTSAGRDIFIAAVQGRLGGRRQQGSPTFMGNPHMRSSCSSTPVESPTPGHLAVQRRGPRS